MGEGALAQELQDALTRSVVLERAGEVVNHQRLTYEWTFLLTSLYKLEQQRRDDTLRRYPELVEYAYEMSSQMASIDELAVLVSPPAEAYQEAMSIEQLVKLRKLPRLLDIAANTYYAHDGLHETAWRSERLKTIAAIYDYHLAQAPYKVGDRTFMPLTSDMRLASSVHEELATHKEGQEAVEHENIAYGLNQDIVTSQYIPWYDQQKVHALFSLYDIDYRRALGSLMGRDDDDSYEGAHIFASVSQRRFYADLYERAHYIQELLEIAKHSTSETEHMLWIGRSLSLMGTMVEIQALGELRDAIIERGELLSIEARQAFLREDHNPRLKRPSNPRKFMHTPNFSFDLVLQVHGRRGPMSRLNIEVKKAHDAETYLNGTYVLNAKDESSPLAFSENIKRLAEAKTAYYKGESIGADQQEVLSLARTSLQPDKQIDEVLSRAS